MIQRTIDGEPPMGGAFDLVVLGVVLGVGPTDPEGYRPVDMDVGIVLRGTAPREYEFFYPASMDEPRAVFIEGASYLVAIESSGPTGKPTTSPCSATKRVVDTEEIALYLSFAQSPTVYRDDLPILEEPAVDGTILPLLATVAAIVVAATGAAAWMFTRKPTGRPEP